MKEILKYFEIDNIKNNKAYFVARIIYSSLIAISFFLNSLLVFGTADKQTYKDVYFQKINLNSCLTFIIVFILTFFIISALGNFYNYIEEKKRSKEENINKRSGKKVFFIAFITILICWLPVILSYVPGGIFDDTVDQITAAKGLRKLSNNQSILYFAIIKFFIFLGESLFGDLNIGLTIYSFLQAIIFITLLSAIITWLYERGVNKSGVALLIAFISLFKLFPIYGTAIWKDSLFAISITYLTFLICKIWYSEGEKLKRPSTIIKYILISLIISFLRNNGQYVIIGTTIILGLYYWKIINKYILRFLIATFVEIIIVGIVQGPVMTLLDRKSEFRETVGIPIQQICYVIAHDGKITEDQLEFINRIEEIDSIKENYTPYNVDMIKYNNFNDEFLENNKAKFLKTWLELGIKNPKMYFKSYLLSTTGYWNISKTSYDWRFVKNYYYLVSYPTYVFKWLWQKDLIYETTGVSLRDKINPRLLVPCAFYEAIVLLSIVYMIKVKRYSNIIILTPNLIMLLTLLISSPIAFSMRYMFALLIILPFSLFLPILQKENNKRVTDR